MIEVLLAIVIVIIAWAVFKSLFAVLVAAVAVALVVWALRNSRQ